MAYVYYVINRNPPFITRSGEPLTLLHSITHSDYEVPVPITFDYEIRGDGVTFPDGTLQYESQRSHTQKPDEIADPIILVSTDGQDHLIQIHVTADIEGDSQSDDISVQVIV